MAQQNSDDFGSVSRLRLAWDHLPSAVRRPIVWTMRSERIRTGLLDRLGIRSRSGFFPLSRGGLVAIDKACEQLAADGPGGDYYEFGLYRGYTLWYAQRAARQAALHSMRFFGFDSFAGLPEVRGEDRKAGIFVSGDYGCERSEVERLLTENGFDWSSAELIEGFFDQSLTPEVKQRHSMAPAALVMIDCDLYQSTVPVLTFLEDLIQDGTVILFDDWYCFDGAPNRGEPRAFAEFLDAHPGWSAEWFLDFPTYGRGFVMRRRQADPV